MDINFELFKVAVFLYEDGNKTAGLNFVKEFKDKIKSLYNKIKKPKTPKRELSEEEKIVMKNGMAIRNIKNPSLEVQLAAVGDMGSAIQHIKNPSEEVQLAAINNNATAIYYIDNPSPKVKQVAEEIYKKNGWDTKDQQEEKQRKMTMDGQEKYLYQSILSIAG